MVALETYYLHVNKSCPIRYELNMKSGNYWKLLLVRNTFCLYLNIFCFDRNCDIGQLGLLGQVRTYLLHFKELKQNSLEVKCKKNILIFILRILTQDVLSSWTQWLFLECRCYILLGCLDHVLPIIACTSRGRDEIQCQQ